MKRLSVVLSILAAGVLTAACSGGSGSGRKLGGDFIGVGGVVNLTEPVADNALLMGGKLSVAAEVKGNVLATGGEVSIGGNLGKDLVAAGGNVKLDAIVAGDVRLGGGEIEIGPATVIAGSTSLAGGKVVFEGNSHGLLKASGGSVQINGSALRDVQARGDEVVIGPQARIEGRLIVHSPQQPQIAETAVVRGGVEYHPDGTVESAPAPGKADAREQDSPLSGLAWLVGMFLAGALFLRVLPDHSAAAATAIARDPIRAVAVGIAVLVGVPMLILVLSITIVGIPLALLLVPLYLLIVFLGWLTAALFIGEKALDAVRSTRPVTLQWRLLALAVALVLLRLADYVPVVGTWIRGLALLAGVGALAWYLWNRIGSLGRPARVG
jgi:hypothetical protein